MNALFARHALLAQGWAKDVLLEWDEGGNLCAVAAAAAAPDGAETVQYVLPGMINLHSHSFQRAFCGLAEKAGAGPDTFWTWRDLMYRFARHIEPEQLEAVAAQLFSECLRYGYTAVCEFHYLHRAPDGALYAQPAEMAERVLAAARLSGIGITMLPVLYSYSGFGEAPLKPQQVRFQAGVDDVLKMIDALEPLRGGQTEVGLAPHSLRATSVAQIREVLRTLPRQRPLHIHIAEQQHEVAQCLAWSGRRPLQWLFDQVELDRRWCLVHATHMTREELHLVVAAGAVAGLCPSTEANLGDGLFPLADFIQVGGRFGIGSDSHVSHSPVEELRWLEYGQRLQHQVRTVAASDKVRDVGAFLWHGALAGGAQASGRQVGALAAGKRADLIVLDDDHPNLCGRAAEDVLGCFIFCGNDNLVKDVLVGGRWVVRGQQHVLQQAITGRFKTTLAALRCAGPPV